MSSQPDIVDGLAVYHLVAGVDFHVPGLRRVVIENRDPATEIVNNDTRHLVACLVLHNAQDIQPAATTSHSQLASRKSS